MNFLHALKPILTCKVCIHGDDRRRVASLWIFPTSTGRRKACIAATPFSICRLLLVVVAAANVLSVTVNPVT